MARSMRACGASRCAFTARRIAQLRDSIQRHVDDLIAAMLDRAGPDGIVDIKTELANQLPVRVIVDLIGVPQSDRDAIWEARPSRPT